MQKEIPKIVVLLFLVPAMCYATPVNWNTVEIDDIEYYIQTDKSIYSLSENVEILFRVTNLRDEEWTFNYMPPVLDVLVAAKEGGVSDTVWFWSWDGTWPAGPKVYSLGPDESVDLNVVWTQIDLNDSWEIEDDIHVSPGTYEIAGRIGSSFFDDVVGDAPVALEVTIIPEPSSLAIFIVGLSVLVKKKKSGISRL